MKAIVIGQKDGKAALLYEDGTMGYKDISAETGSRIEIKKSPDKARRSTVIKAVCGVAAAAALAVFGGGYYFAYDAVSYVSVDVNPSLEFSLNRLDHVIGVEALNDDAVDIVEDLIKKNVKGDTLSSAVEKTEEVFEDKDYFDGEDDYMLFSVACDDNGKKEGLTRELQDTISSMSDRGLNISVVTSSTDDRSRARSLSISTGRYQRMISDRGAAATDEQDVIVEYRDKPVRDMIQKKEEKQEPPQEDDKDKDKEAEPQTIEEKETKPQAAEEKEIQPQEAEEKEVPPQEAEEKEIPPQDVEEKETLPPNAEEKEIRPQEEEKKETQPPVTGGQEVQQPDTGGRETQPPVTGGQEIQSPDMGGHEEESPDMGENETQPPSTGGQEMQPPNMGENEIQPPSIGGNEMQPPNMGGQDEQRPNMGENETQPPNMGGNEMQPPNAGGNMAPPQNGGKNM